MSHCDDTTACILGDLYPVSRTSLKKMVGTNTYVELYFWGGGDIWNWLGPIHWAWHSRIQDALLQEIEPMHCIGV